MVPLEEVTIEGISKAKGKYRNWIFVWCVTMGIEGKCMVIKPSELYCKGVPKPNYVMVLHVNVTRGPRAIYNNKKQ